jgi:hypothetical protein
MTERIVKPLPFFQAVKKVASFYWHVFREIIGLVVLASLIQAIISLLIPQNPTVGLAVSLLGAVISMFFYAWIIERADSVLMNRPGTVRTALRVAKKRFLPLIGVLAVYIILAIVMFLFGYGMQILGNTLNALLIFAIITLCIGIFIFTLFAFTMPAVVLDLLPVFKSFETSVRLVWGNWWRTFLVFVIYVIPIILLSLLVWWLSSNIFTLTLYEFIYHIIIYPLMVSLILVLYHDLKLRHQILGFKRVAEHK